MSSRLGRYDDKGRRKAGSPHFRRRKFTEVPEVRERRSPREMHRHRGPSGRNVRRRSRSGSHSRSRSRRGRLDPSVRAERRHWDSPREKRRFREERENDEPKKRKRSHSPKELLKDDVIYCEESNFLDKLLSGPLFLLNERFSLLDAGRPLVVEENVSVEIERKIAGREKFAIPKVLDPKAISIPKSALEGRRPMNSRDEFKGWNNEFPSSNWRPEPRFLGRGIGRRTVQPMGNVREDDKRNREDWNGSPSKFNENLVERQRDNEENSSGLPDFSKRPGKYSYEAWKEKPELIPKGKNYFEHDVRNQGVIDESQRRSFENRGRQWTRGRVPRGRGAYNRSGSDMGVWKHDKFEELLAEERQGC